MRSSFEAWNGRLCDRRLHSAYDVSCIPQFLSFVRSINCNPLAFASPPFPLDSHLGGPIELACCNRKPSTQTEKRGEEEEEEHI